MSTQEEANEPVPVFTIGPVVILVNTPAPSLRQRRFAPSGLPTNRSRSPSTSISTHPEAMLLAASETIGPIVILLKLDWAWLAVAAARTMHPPSLVITRFSFVFMCCDCILVFCDCFEAKGERCGSNRG